MIFKMSLLPMTLLMMIMSSTLTQDQNEDQKIDNENEEVLNDQSKLKDYTLKWQFLMVDNSGVATDPFHYYMFNMYAKSNLVPETNQKLENLFILDMYHYNRDYPKTLQGETLDLTDLEFEKPREMQISKTMLTPLKMKNDFYKAELEISQNDCLTLLLFLDAKESTKFHVDSKNHDVYFDFRDNADNNFNVTVDNYWGHSKESFDVVYNDMLGTFEHVYLKVLCPYYSVFGEDNISFKITKFHEDYQIDSKPPQSISNKSG